SVFNPEIEKGFRSLARRFFSETLGGPDTICDQLDKLAIPDMLNLVAFYSQAPVKEKLKFLETKSDAEFLACIQKHLDRPTEK
ncbi:MAG: hypothetical protein IH796_00895, partial [Deltaproteobacteria bacterium]|nr:hypothetical protein [Deltaproteobacteria bacterium]